MLRPTAPCAPAHEPSSSPRRTSGSGGIAAGRHRTRRWSSAVAVGALAGASMMWAAAAPPASATDDMLVSCSGANHTATTSDLALLRQVIVNAEFVPGPDVIRL